MRRFLNFKKDHVSEVQASTPSLPNDISYSELIHVTKRGFIAKKMATYLEMDPAETDRIYFLSLSNIDCHALSEENPYQEVIYHSDCLLQWTNNGDKVSEKVDALSIDNQYKNAILKVYDIYHKQWEDPIKLKPRTQEVRVDEKWAVYRDVMYSATQGKFTLITKEELSANKTGDVLVEHDIKVIADIPKCRDAAKQVLENLEYHKSDMMSMLLVISEAITNTLKHAEEGKMILIEDKEKGEVKFLVSDNGCGFDLESLPKKTLMAGYSTKKSLGQGFQLMLKMSKQVLLYTSEQGSSIILKFDVRKNGDVLHGTG